MEFTQLRFAFMDEGEPLPIASNDNLPAAVGPSDDRQGGSASLPIRPAQRTASCSILAPGEETARTHLGSPPFMQGIQMR